MKKTWLIFSGAKTLFRLTFLLQTFSSPKFVNDTIYCRKFDFGDWLDLLLEKKKTRGSGTEATGYVHSATCLGPGQQGVSGWRTNENISVEAMLNNYPRTDTTT